jgi:hypothetical protein
LIIEPPLSITTTSLPAASISSAYNQPVETVGGIGALTFNIVPGSGTLPQNFGLNPTAGIISGNPIAPAGTFPFTVRVADEGGQQDTQALSISVTPTTPPNITNNSLPNGTVGLPYSGRVQATGGIGELTWSASAGLPPGLLLNPSGASGGTISGTPSSGGPFNFTVTITDSVGQTDTQALSINVTPFSITTTSLAPGSIGQPYSEPVNTVGGTTPLNFSIVPPGTLPPGLNLHPTTGLISGTPGVPADTSTFTVRVTDAGGREDTQELSITINPSTPPQITTGSLPNATIGLPYSERVQATGGIGELTWSASAGLPPCLILEPSGPTGGTISGTPSSEGPSNFTVTVTDSLGQTDTQALSITVSAAPLVITTDSLPGGGIGQDYSQPVRATGGTAPLTFSLVTPGTLPPNLDLDQTTGVISGTPVLIGTYSFTVRVADVAGQEATQDLSIAINLIVIP